MQRGMLRIGTAAVCLAAAIALTGCWAPGTPENGSTPGGGVKSTPTAETSTPITPPPTTIKTIVVPDVLGMYYDDAAAALKDVGLEPVEMSIHGPIDEDAGDIGGIYRQTPKAGEAVAPGTAVELRYWWESQ
jgi:hypothetical protein